MAKRRRPRSRYLRRDIVVVGASAGGFRPLLALLSGLPRDLAAAVFVVVHIPEHVASNLPGILAKAGGLASRPLNGRGEEIEYGRIYVGAPGRHLTMTRGRVRNGRGLKQGLHRPSVDVLFRSAAKAFGARVIGVVLSGFQHDGSEGLREIKRRGGTTVVQDPRDAQFDDMPRSAIALGAPDFCTPGRALARLLRRLTA